MRKVKLVFASDHGGFVLKQKILEWAKKANIEFEDLGPTTDEKSINYATQGIKLAKNVVNDKKKLGIGICGTGIGISFAVNRIKGIRGARVTSKKDAILAKQHNNANILLLGGRQISSKKAIKIIKIFLENEYQGGRHKNRIAALDK